MQLDTITLIAAGSFVSIIGTLVLLGAWAQLRHATALLWWSAASGLGAIAIGMLAFGLANADPLVTIVASGVLVTVPPLTWGGVRIFNHHRAPLIVLAAGPAAWLVAGATPLPGGPQQTSMLASFVVWIVYLTAADVELWRTRSEPLRARWPLMALFATHALVFAAGIVDTLNGIPPSDPVPPLTSMFSVIHFEHIIYAIGTAISMVVMCRERLEQEYLNASRVDTLTGSANRGAFFDSAERTFRRCQLDGTPLSVIMFDLDNFKAINDNHGHTTGDRILRLFADTVRDALRPNDLLGRYGGEEFVVVLPGANVEVAFVIAERIRHAFADATQTFDGIPYTASVSAGVAAAGRVDSLESTLTDADAAMYRAKQRGRNRVERAAASRDDSQTNVIRVA